MQTDWKGIHLTSYHWKTEHILIWSLSVSNQNFSWPCQNQCKKTQMCEHTRSDSISWCWHITTPRLCWYLSSSSNQNIRKFGIGGSFGSFHNSHHSRFFPRKVALSTPPFSWWISINWTNPPYFPQWNGVVLSQSISSCCTPKTERRIIHIFIWIPAQIESINILKKYKHQLWSHWYNWILQFSLCLFSFDRWRKMGYD